VDVNIIISTLLLGTLCLVQVAASLCVREEDGKMANSKITIPFPVWDLLNKQEEIGRVMEEFGVHSLRGTPRKITFKSVPHSEKECDRLKVTIWYPGVYITAVIGGHEYIPDYGAKSTYWELKGYKARWEDYLPSGKIFLSFSLEEEDAFLLECIALGKGGKIQDLKKVLKIRETKL